MNKVTVVLGMIIAALGGVVGTQYVASNSSYSPDETEIRTLMQSMLTSEIESLKAAAVPVAPVMVELTPEPEVLASTESVAALDAVTLNPMIEEFLMGDPRILQRVSQALQAELEREETNASRVALASLQAEIYEDPGHVVVGNPNGDVTIVEFYDYNCHFCRQSLPDIARLIDEDPNIKIIFKEFPVLSNESLEAAKIGMAVGQIPGFDYWEFHEEVFSSRGQINASTAIRAALNQGLDGDTLRIAANSDATLAALQRTYDLAQQLGITGTPTFIVGDQIVPGALGYDALKSRIENIRECGSASCDPEG